MRETCGYGAALLHADGMMHHSHPHPPVVASPQYESDRLRVRLLDVQLHESI